jgi:low affinity Fe/Cu permease
MTWFDKLSDATVKWAGSASAVLISVGSTAVWGALGPVYHFSDTWQLVANTATTIVTFWMVFVIQHSQNKDSAAVQAKLDELILAVSAARNDLIGLDLRTEQEIEEVRAEHELKGGGNA